MKKILPNFKDDTDRIIVVAMIIISIFCFFIPPLIAILCLKNRISEASYAIAKAFLNFELLLFLISLLFTIPIIGWLAGLIFIPVIGILNIVIVIIDLCAIANNSEVKVPVLFEFI